MIQKTIGLFIVLVNCQLQAQILQNISAKQEGKTIVVSYEIYGGYADRVYSPTLYYSTDGGTNFNKCHSISTSYGKPNETNQIIWNVTNDLDYFGKNNIVFKVVAYGFWNSIKNEAYINGHTYKTVKIGEQEWMAEDLIMHDGIWTIDWAERVTKANREFNGWHLPSKSEWYKLINFLGDNAAEKLRSKTGWEGRCKKEGNNASGLSIKPSKNRKGLGSDVVGYWTSNSYGYSKWESKKNNVYIEIRCSSTRQIGIGRNYQFPVRLVRNFYNE